MSLEDICISLETAKKLFKAGIKIDSEFYWVQKSGYSFQSDWALITSADYLKLCFEPVYDDVHEVIEAYPAPTAEEIERYITDDYKDARYSFESFYEDGAISIRCYDYKHESLYKSEWYGNKTEALSEMLLWLQENGYLKGEKNV